jgi:hypothetical protein
MYSSDGIDIISRGIPKLGRVLRYGDISNGNFICDIQSLENDCVYKAIISPSPYGWAMPEVNSMVVYLDYSGLKRVISVVHDLDNRPIDKIVSDGIIESPSDISGMLPGDAYVGKHGRAYFNGDVTIFTDNVRATLMLDDNEGIVDVNGYNFKIYTADESIKIFTESSTPTTFGDSLTIQKCLAGTGTTFTSFNLDNSGSISIRAGIFGDDQASYFLVGHLGDIELNNQASSFLMPKSGEVSLDASKLTVNALSLIDMSSSGMSMANDNFAIDTGILGVTATNATLNATLFDITSNVNITGALSLSGVASVGGLSSAGAMAISGISSFTGGLTSSGTTTLSGAVILNGVVNSVGANLASSIPGTSIAVRGLIPILINGQPYSIACI